MTLVSVVIAYLLGCIPFGLIVAKAKGIDLRAAGSGNIGATNAARVMGRGAGAMTLMGDMLKGSFAVYLALSLAGPHAALLAAGAAVLGHDYPVFMLFRGGKGVATSLGVLLVVQPVAAVICIAAWIASLFIWRYSSLAALISFGLLPVLSVALYHNDSGFVMLSLLLTALIYIKHKDNIARLATGREPKVGGKKAEAAVIVLALAASVFVSGAAHAEENAPAITAPQAQTQTAAPAQATAQMRRYELLQRWADIRKMEDSNSFEGIPGALKELEGRCQDMGITSDEELSASMVRQGSILLGASRVGDAFALFDSATRISPNFPPAYYAKGWALFAKDKLKALATLDLFREGYTRSFGDFWWSFYYAGNKITSLLFTFALLFSLFGLFMALRYVPLLAHDISEWLRKPELENRIKYMALPLVFLAVLVVLGYWWASSLAFLSLWVYFNKKERTLAVLFFVLLVFMPEIMSSFANFAQAGGNRLLWVMDRTNKGRVDEGSDAYLRRLLKEQPDNEDVLMALAQIARTQRRYQEAGELYGRLVTLEPESPVYRNNLGNILFLNNNYDGAIRQYQAAINSDPKDALAYFNMSQVYGESLMFTERDAADLQARRLNPAAVADYRNKAGSTPARMVFDQQVKVNRFWKLAFAKKGETASLADTLWSTTVKVLPLNGTRVAGIGFLILAFAVNALRKKGVYAHYCNKCGKVSCRKCQKPYYNKELCPECHQIFVKMEGVEAKDRVRKVLETRERLRKQGLVYRAASLVLPGTGHFMLGSTYRGFIFTGLFVLLIKDVFFGRFYEVPYDFTLPILRPDTLAMFIVLVWVYLLAQLDTHRITK